MRLLHAVLLSVVIVLALNVGLPQARALGDDETDVSAGDVHPSRETAIDEESRSLFPPSFTASFKSSFGKMFSASTYNLPKVRAQRRVARKQKAARVEAARLANERAAAEKSMHSEIDTLVGEWNKAMMTNGLTNEQIPIGFFSSNEYQRALSRMDDANLIRGADDRLNMFEILTKKVDEEELKRIADIAATKDDYWEQAGGNRLKAFLKTKTLEEATPLSRGTRTLADRRQVANMRVEV